MYFEDLQNQLSKIESEMKRISKRITELEKMTVIGKEYQNPTEIKVSGVPYKVNIEDITGGGN